MTNFTATHRFARIAPRKTRLVVDLIRGKSANEALRILQSINKRSAPMIRRVLVSAIASANASKDGINPNDLVVTEARVDGGPTLKRFRPGPMGRAMRIRKRTSHIVVVVGTKKETGKSEAKGKGKQPAEAKK